jgi:hypothetical protein
VTEGGPGPDERRAPACWLDPDTPGVAYYEDAGECTGAITVHAALPVADRPAARTDFEVVDLSDVPDDWVTELQEPITLK